MKGLNYWVEVLFQKNKKNPDKEAQRIRMGHTLK